MAGRSSVKIAKLRVLVLTAFVAVALSGFLLPRAASTAEGAGAEPQRRGQTRRRPAARNVPQPARRYTNFSHQTPKHRQACDTCHKFPSANWKEARKGDDAFPDVTQYPEHASCLGCHRQQFFARERPSPAICSVCHQTAVPRQIVLYPFPTLAERYAATPRGQSSFSDFAVFFPHEKHEGLFGGLGPDRERERGVRFLTASFKRGGARAQEDAAKANEACANCHQTYQPQGDSDDEFVTKPPKGLPDGAFWLKKGTFKTSPNGHASCFTCHSQDGGISPAPNECAKCHVLPPAGLAARSDFDPKLAAAMGVSDRSVLKKWRARQAGAFRHEWFSHNELSCTTCHKMAEMNTADERTKKVPVLSCGGDGAGCHITPTADEGGILNTELDQKRANAAFQCVKCHVVLGREQPPATHASAVSAISK